MADKTASSGGGIWELIKTVVIALLIAGVFRSLFFQPFWIPSGSMKDTLLIGDFVFVNKMAYGYSYASCPSVKIPAVGLDVDASDICGFMQNSDGRFLASEPERGDVVVFRHPVTGRDYIKRLIGLPGDQIQIKAGIIHLNGVPMQQVPAGVFTETMEPQGAFGNRPRCENGAVGDGGMCNKSRAIETNPEGKSYAVLNIGPSFTDNTKVFTVPAGHYFMMGDNRDNSSDSRVDQIQGGVGFVPFKDLIGRADRIVFSSAGRSMFFFWTWRSDRFFKAVQ